MEKLWVDGQQIAFERAGDGEPVVLLHGLPGDSRLWRPQLETLADEFTLIAWDAPGCGRSSDPDGELVLTDVARYLVTFLDALGVRHPHVVGLSWGASLALELHRIAPGLPRSLVLAGGYAGWAGSLPPDEVARRLEAYLEASRARPGEALRGWGTGFFSQSAPPDLVEAAVSIASQVHPRLLAALARSFAETDLRDVLPTIRVPTLVLHGDADTRSPLAVGRALHDNIPGARLAVLQGVGHISNFEDPERFNAEVRQFLVGVDPSLRIERA